MDVEDDNMEQFHVISLLGADARFCNDTTNLAQATRELNRICMQRHLRHAASWLLQAAVVAGLFLLGRFGIEGAIGGALSWMCHDSHDHMPHRWRRVAS